MRALTITEITQGLDAEELEALADRIVAALESGTAASGPVAESAGVNAAAAAVCAEIARLLPAVVRESAEGAPFPAERTAEDGMTGYSSSAAAGGFSVPAGKSSYENGFYGSGTEKLRADRRQMENISEFFMRDSRRYDSGFERY